MVVFSCSKTYLNFHWPGEVADIDVESNVGVAAEIKLLVGETILELLYVAAGDDGDLLTGLSPSYKAGRPRDVQIEVFRGVNKHVQISILLIRSCHKVDGGVVSVILLRQTEGKLVIYQQCVITRSL